jgi:hypothetical protein
MGNMNSLSLYDQSRSWKTTRLKETNKRYQTDGMLLQETGVDFCQLPEELSFPAILGDQDVHVATANNVTEDRACYQAGGVASILYARLAGFLLGWSKDPTGLGRWVWFKSAQRRDGQLLWLLIDQSSPLNLHETNFSAVCSQFGPNTMRFLNDLLWQLQDWKRRGGEIILFMDLACPT